MNAPSQFREGAFFFARKALPGRDDRTIGRKPLVMHVITFMMSFMMNAREMTTADEIVSLIVTDEWTGAEFSEAYVASLVSDVDSYNVAADFLVTVGLLESTLVERNGRLVAGLRVAR